jgi:UDP-N-acetylmuramoyl-tripeptide--D-alanyl-D-alanine ligase
MNLWTKKELITALGSELLNHNLTDTVLIDEIIIDSRKSSKNKLFIALKGENHDAHDFLEQVFANGCEIAIIHQEADFSKFSLHNKVILVKDTFSSLYKLADFSRNRSAAKIIGITGSVGKTGTKEMLNLAFATQGKTYATIGNLNNHIGLPLSLANFPKDCAYGIFEMGMNHLGEIEPLSKLAKPHLVIITNVGPVHIENFKNEEEIALAKSEIFAGLVERKIILINHDSKYFEFLKDKAHSLKIPENSILSFGENDSSNYQLLNIDIKDSELSEVKAKTKDNIHISYEISTSHKATIFNSIITLACLDLLGNDVTKGISTFRNLKSTKGRGKITEIKSNGKTVTIIDDSYNASVLSMKAGLEHASSLKKALNKNRVVAALGDMLELGKKSSDLHAEVINYLQDFKIDFAILVGDQMTLSANKLNKNIYKTFPNSETASDAIENLLQDGDILYVKGSHGIKMEKIIDKLT